MKTNDVVKKSPIEQVFSEDTFVSANQSFTNTHMFHVWAEINPILQEVHVGSTDDLKVIGLKQGFGPRFSCYNTNKTI